ncbi:MAG: type II toxin-antitoxin system Phd/YefM family antitoxin [Phycisphaerae bacterium]
MKLVPARELRIRPSKVWKDLRETREIVITARGQPIAVMVPTTGDDVEDTLRGVRQGLAMENLRRLQEQAKRKGVKMTMEEIDAMIDDVRRRRGK